jgi:hypothetical protein
VTQLATEWLTTDEVLSLRSEMNWASPVAPFEPGQLWCVWDHGRTLEWFTHPADASTYLEDGIVVDGERLAVHLIDRWPLLNAWQIRAYRTPA